MDNDNTSSIGMPGTSFLKLYLISWPSQVSLLNCCENLKRECFSLSSNDFCTLFAIFDINPNLLVNKLPMVTIMTRLKKIIYAKNEILFNTSWELMSRKGKATMMIRLQTVSPESFSVTATKVLLIRLPYFLVAAMIR